MERLRALTLAAAAGLAPAAGCIHVHTDANGAVKSVGLKAEPPAPPAGGGPLAPADPPGGVVQQTSASVPAGVPAAAAKAAAAKLTHAPGQPVDFAVTWQPKLAKLPDPTRSGEFGTGIVGQMFLFGDGPKMPFALADGRLTVELFDESKPGVQPTRLEGWVFGKDDLRRLVTFDERFGKCYALFLPWPGYRPDITRVKLAARYEPAAGYPLYAPPTIMTIDTTTSGEGGATARTVAPQPAPISFPPPGGTAPTTFGPAFPMPAPTPGGRGAPPVPAAGGVPAGLPPLTLTLPTR